jgi:hypothetical protein
MNATQLPFLVEGILMVTAIIFGIMLSKAGKPYGKVKVVIHLFLYTWLTVGFGFIFAGTLKAMTVILVPVILFGLAVLTQPVTGIMMMVSKKTGKVLPRIHLVSAILMVLSDICAFIVAGAR